MLAGLTVAVVLAAEMPALQAPLPAELPETAPANAPARGSVPGPWAYAQLGAALGNSVLFDQYSAELGLGLDVAAGFGAEVGGVKLVPVLSFSSVYRPVQSFRGPAALRTPAFTWSPVALTVASPDVFHESRFTGLRLTPIIGFTMPTASLNEVPITTVSVAAQLERRFGQLEFAWRVTGEGVLSRVTRPMPPSFFTPEWRLTNRLFAELWLVPSLSVAIGVTIVAQWDRIIGFIGTTTLKREFLGGTIQANWAFTELFGVTFDLATYDQILSNQVPFPFWSSGAFNQNSTQFVLAAWFRTDALLMRNWLDR